jgi:hypothetical protein
MYTWTVADNTNVTGESTVTSSQSQISQTLTNTSISNQTVVYTVTPKNTSAGSGYSVGSTFNGGVIAYIFKPGDNGYAAGKVLIVKNNFLPTGSCTSPNGWTMNSATASTSALIGEGLNNTNNLYNAGHTSTGEAIGYIYGYSDGTYSDWFAPSIDELTTIFNNIYSSLPTFTQTQRAYRSSTEIPTSLSQTYAFMKNSNNIGYLSMTQNDGGCGMVLLSRYDVLPIPPATCNGATFTVTVTVNSPSVGGSISGAATVCSGTNSTTLTLSGNTGSVTSWESSLDNFSTAATPIVNSTTSYTATNLSATTYYRAIVTNGSCAAANSALATVTVSPTSISGSISGAATVCSGTNSTTLTLSGNTGSITSWESSLDNFATAGTTISNTTTTYTATNLSATTYYRAVVTSGSCAAANSASAIVAVNSSLGGTVAGSTSVCAGTNSTILTLSGHSGSIQWQSSSDNSVFADISSQTSPTYTATNLSAVTYYRAVVTNGSCTAANSTSATVNLSPTSVSGSISGAATVCSGTNSTTLTLSGYTGSITSWESSLDNFATAATTIANTTTTYTATNLSATTYYRAVVTSGSCAAANSASVTMAINVPAVVTNKTATVCSGGTFTVTPTTGSGNTVPSGTTYTWTVADNTNVTGDSTVTSSQSKISQTLTNTSISNQTVVYTVTPKNTSAGSGYSVGSTFNGGVIAYIFKPGDNGYTPGKVLIVKNNFIPVSTTCSNTGWTMNSATASTSALIGEGLNNTNNLYNAGHTSTGQAIGYIYGYSDGTYSDWFAPSIDELTFAFNNVYSSLPTYDGVTPYAIRSSTEIPTSLSQTYSLRKNANNIGYLTAASNDGGCAMVLLTRYDVLPILPATCDGAPFTVTVTVISPSFAGSISGAATVCSGTNSTTLTLSGNTGSVTRWESSLDNFSTAATPIVNSTTSYTATSLSATTYYRAVVLNGTCTANSASATVTFNSNNTWTGTSNNLWNTAANWSCGVVPTANHNVIISSGTPIMDVDFTNPSGKTFTITGTGSLTINAGNTLTIAGTTDFGGKLVTLKSTLSGTAAIGTITGTLSNASNVTVERYIQSAARRYRFLSSPVQNQTIANWMTQFYVTGPCTAAPTTLGAINDQGWHSNWANITAPGAYNASTNPRAEKYTSIRTYNETVSGNLNLGFTDVTPGTALTAGKGFKTYIRGAIGNTGQLNGTVTGQTAVTLSLNGTINQGDVNANPTRTGTSLLDDGWNLLGNPYPSAYDLKAQYDAAQTSNLNNIDANYYVFDAISNGYKGYNPSASSGAGAGTFTSGIVPSGAAFFIQATGTPTFIFKEAFKTTSAPIAMHKKALNSEFSIKYFKDSAESDEFIISMMEGATLNKDRFDINKLRNENLNLSSFGLDTLQLMLSSIPPVISETRIKLNVEATAIGTYNFDFKNMDNFDAGVSVSLYDRFTNTTTDVKAKTKYTFVMDAGVNQWGKNRFELILNGKATGNNTINIVENAKLIVFPNPATNLLNVNISNANFKNSIVIIYNVSGQQLMNSTMIGSNAALNIEDLSNGVYFINVSNENGFNKTVKFVK